MTTETTHARPTHRIYAVRKGKDDKAYWDTIGAAWPHRDGEGFNLKLDYLPLNGAELVIRKPKADAEEGRLDAPREAAPPGAASPPGRAIPPCGSRAGGARLVRRSGRDSPDRARLPVNGAFRAAIRGAIRPLETQNPPRRAGRVSRQAGENDLFGDDQFPRKSDLPQALSFGPWSRIAEILHAFRTGSPPKEPACL